MKTISTLFSAPLVMGLSIALFVLGSNAREDHSVLQWCVAVLAILLIGLIVGALLNFAVFGPIYWFLGRLHSKKTQAVTKGDDDVN